MGLSRQLKILFLTPYPFDRVGSQRFRFEQYWDVLNNNYDIEIQSFFSEEGFNILYSEGKFLQKAVSILKGYLKRLFVIFKVWQFDVVFIHRETSPLGPPVFEFLIAKIFRKKIIYDFDDAIWLPNTSNENSMAAFAKCHWKIKWICKWAYKITCGNEFLCEFARTYNSRVEYIPTTLDVDKVNLKNQYNSEPLTIGWTGTHSTLKYLDFVIPILNELNKKFKFHFIVIADKNPEFKLENYSFIKWQKITEWIDLAKIDIGLMPLENTKWEEGKCGFKALQYMAAGIPAIVSPTLANRAIVSDSINGFICSTQEEWHKKLTTLLSDKELRKEFGINGRKSVESKFSKQAWEETYINIFSL